MAKDPKALRFKTAGYSETDNLAVDVGPSKCGDIQDGVVFWHDDRGGWVLSYADLMTIAKAATKARPSKREQGT